MATSFEAFPPPSTTVYPTTSSYHSGGSYGSVFIVLAVIVVVSVVACVMGRFCGKRSSGQAKTKKSKNKHQSHGNERMHKTKERDIEVGFVSENSEAHKKIPKVKVAPNGHGHGHGKQGQRPPHNGPGSGHFGGPPVGHRQLPMMECPRNF